MKAVLCVCDFVLVLIAPCLATSNREIQAIQAVHEAWEIAFERADINAVEKVWAHDGEVFIVTPLGTRHNGWASVKGALKNLSALLDQTTINVKDPFLTIGGDEASMTMTYQWSPARDRVFPLTERYRHVNGDWKIYLSDSQGQTLPLRPEDEKAIKRLTSQVRNGLLAKDTAAIAEVVADDFTHAESLAVVQPKGKGTTTWGQVKQK